MARRGKTETIKERAIWVYLPSIELRRRWQELAGKHGTSLSKWVVEMVEEALRPIEDSEYKSRGELEKEAEALKGHVKELYDKVRQLSTLKENLERELRRYRAQPFLHPDFEGVRDFWRELPELMRSTRGVEGKPKPLNEQEILEYLGVDPREAQAVKAVSTQLEILEAYGLVRSSPKGWRWVEDENRLK